MRTRLAAVSSLIADDTRAQILAALMDGRAHAQGELARHAGVSPSTASQHLSKLLDGGMVAVEAQGRRHYFRLAGPHVAELLEALGACPPVIGAPASAARGSLNYARTCYDHLAGDLAVRIYDQLTDDRHLTFVDGHLHLTPSGIQLLDQVGVDIGKCRRARRPMARTCLDWTERRHHLAGSAGAAVLTVLLNNRWVAPGPQPRAIRVTRAGKTAILRHLGVHA